MASLYPGAKDALPTNHSDATAEIIHAAVDNDQSDAINKIENELGVLPKGQYADVGSRLVFLEFMQFNSQNTTAYTLVFADATRCVQMINAAVSVVTVPANASVAFRIGTVIPILQGFSAGQVTIAAAAGVTLHEVNSSFKTQGPAALLYLIKTGTDTWLVTGATA